VLWKPAKTHFQLRRIQYVDFHQTEFDDALQNLLNELTVQGLEADGTSALTPAELLSGEPEGAAEILRILPSPFAWMEIPGGPVQLTPGGYITADMGETMVASFHIARVPVTNGQYAIFKEAGGYESHEYWSDDGWQIKAEAGWQQPAFWDDEHFNGPQQPVVGVSWFEAMAFCRWLSAATGLAITLPVEQQWQRAAIGDAGHRFPWGDKIDTTYANFASAVGSTSPVTDYLAGASPYGVLDMSGNVWEWTLTDWHTGQTLSEAADPGCQPVLRGGSWYGLADFLRADHRYSGVRTLRYDDIGFRVMTNSLPATED
jgi:formylglycine-generating enzyme required for sulfatase activity